MIYILVIWSTVAVGGPSPVIRNDWRPIGEFQSELGRLSPSYKTAEQMCHEAARQLNIKPEFYRCVRSK